MVGVLGEAWRYRGLNGESTGGRMAVLGTMWWQSWGLMDSTGGSMVGAL